MAGENASYPITLSLNAWHMITYAVSSTGYSIYVDGALGTSATWSATPNSVPAAATCMSAGGLKRRFDNAAFDDFQLYGTALTAAQINALYLTRVTAYAACRRRPRQIAGGATLDLGGISQTVAALSDLSGSGGTMTNSNSRARDAYLGATGGTTTFSGVIAGGSGLGTISLVMSGGGTQVLAGSNTYTGGTILSAGQLDLNNASALGSGTFTISGGTIGNTSGAAITFPPTTRRTGTATSPSPAPTTSISAPAPSP